MPRLLILCEYPTLLGGERSMLSTLSAVTTAGFDIQVAAPPDGSLAEALRDVGVPVVPWRAHDGGGERFLGGRHARGEPRCIGRQDRPRPLIARKLEDRA